MDPSEAPSGRRASPSRGAYEPSTEVKAPSVTAEKLKRSLHDLEASALGPLDWTRGQPPAGLSIRGVYALYESRELMYIGMSGRGEQLIVGRMRQHKEHSRRSSELARRVNDPERIKGWHVRALEIDDDNERRRFEHYAIAIRWPPYNRWPRG